MPPHVAIQRAEAAKRRATKQYQDRIVSEAHDVFQRIDMHGGDKDVCWEWRGAHGLGTRGEYRPRCSIKGKDMYVYRVVYELYTGYKLLKGEVVRHNCDHSWCCNPYHMIIGTQADNVRDMVERERVGMKHYQVRRIMQMLEIGCTAEFVRDKMKEGYNMSLDVSVIRKIRMRRIYKHIEWPWGDAWSDQRSRRLLALRKQRALASDPNCAILNSQQQGATTHVKQTTTEEGEDAGETD